MPIRGGPRVEGIRSLRFNSLLRDYAPQNCLIAIWLCYTSSLFWSLF